MKIEFHMKNDYKLIGRIDILMLLIVMCIIFQLRVNIDRYLPGYKGVLRIGISVIDFLKYMIGNNLHG